MDAKFFDSARKLIEADRQLGNAASKILSVFVNDLNIRKQEVSDHQQKVRDAIDNGTRITKHRIPL